MRLAADAAHQFGGIELDRSKPLSFRLDGHKITGFAGDTILSAALAAGIDTYGQFDRTSLGLGERFAPLVAGKRGDALPMERTPAIDGLDLTTIGPRARFAFGQPHSLRHRIDDLSDPPWLRGKPETTLTGDLLVIGGGVAGLAAADAAAAAGHSVILVERRPWLGGDARYFGAVGDDETPEALTTRLAAQLAARSNATVLTRADVFALSGGTAILHQVDTTDGTPRSRIVAVMAPRIVIATGATQRLPVFPGNRAPRVIPAIAAYHLAKRYGVTRGPSAVVATQSNYGYRLAFRLHDAGIALRRVIDTRIAPQSRFIDFAKAGGLTLGSGQIPLSAEREHFAFGHTAGAGGSTSFEASQLVVSGTWQPDLALWMLAGGGVRWSSERAALVAIGRLDNIAIAGSAAGYRSLRATAESGRAAQATLFDGTPEPIVDEEPGTSLETPDAPTPSAPLSHEVPSFLDSGRSLAVRPVPRQSGAAAPRAHALTLADVAASVELGLTAPADAGTIAEERGAPGADLEASVWRPIAPSASTTDPVYLARRFGDDPIRRHLVVDGRRKFSVGTLVYKTGSPRDPEHAIGVIIDEAPIGGVALLSKSAARLDRFIVEMAAGPSPARVAKDEKV